MDATSKPTSPRFGRRQKGPVRRLTAGCSVTEQEQARILAALERAGFNSASEGIRQVLLEWAKAA